ncbi:hypothetical protein PFISCL1PPCAC_25171 [Pristionchus fissidentatus]|uniref:Zinc metalloproteinase n=1 Tax=Pristionchus fissidentatus TaxID=1538716 RepID=A0AAV5WP13_9BILA|nr:hypothetical protein PFISCL1PPCAC_25170 [Pristionchus fissidentatus]GMT33874.1 hypothetical protein PFISCL1PPCAC_25171 [Pristionchus fissidentatus]
MHCTVLLALVASVLAGPIDFESDLKHNVDLGRLQKDLASLEERLTNTPDVEAEISLLKEAYGKTVILSPTPINGSTCKDEDINEINEKAGQEKDLFEGDLLLTNEQLSLIENIHSSNRSRRQALSDAGYSWGTVNPVIPYSYSAGYAMDRRPTIEAAMKFWEKYTCVRFKPATSGYRVEVRESAGCSSYVGKINDRKGTQGLNLGQNCMSIGTICHELSHTFGFFHVQSRFDRDRYVDIDFNNILSGDKHNFDLEPADKTTLRDIPYEFGSNMHYYHKDFARDESKPAIYAKPAYKVYQEGMMGRLPTFYDILGVNKHFNCAANCKSSISCSNGGIQDVNNCSKCLCPLGWAGDKCTQRPAGTKTVAATTTMQTMRSNFDKSTKGIEYKTQYYLFQAPAGMKVQMTPKVLGTRWSNSCDPMGIEIKFLKDARPSGLQVCDWRVQQPTITSETNEMLVQAYTLGDQSVVEMQYKAVN